MPAAPAEPRLRLIRQRDTHRLVPSKYRAPESVLARIADDDGDLRAIFDLEQATNDRLLAEHQRLPDIGPHELVFGVPAYHVINAAFCHAHPQGARFNGPDRGAWYAAFDLRTSQAEVAFHRSVELAEIEWHADEIATYDDYLADFSGEFHDLRRDRRFADCPRSRQLRVVAGARPAAARPRLARRRLPERAAAGWHVPGVLPAGGRGQRAARRAVRLHVLERGVAVGQAGGLVRVDNRATASI